MAVLVDLEGTRAHGLLVAPTKCISVNSLQLARH